MPESSPLVSRASTRAQAAEHVQYSKPKRALGPTRMGPEKMPIPQLADILARNVARPVIDQTGLTGRY